MSTKAEIWVPTYRKGKITAGKYNIHCRAAFTYSAKGNDSAVCSSKMSRNAFLSEALYEADKALDKFA